MSVRRKAMLTIFAVITITVLLLGFLLYNGYIWFNNPDPKVYPVRGIDVSVHQKEIDWELV